MKSDKGIFITQYEKDGEVRYDQLIMNADDAMDPQNVNRALEERGRNEVIIGIAYKELTPEELEKTVKESQDQVETAKKFSEISFEMARILEERGLLNQAVKSGFFDSPGKNTVFH